MFDTCYTKSANEYICWTIIWHLFWFFLFTFTIQIDCSFVFEIQMLANSIYDIRYIKIYSFPMVVEKNNWNVIRIMMFNICDIMK